MPNNLEKAIDMIKGEKRSLALIEIASCWNLRSHAKDKISSKIVLLLALLFKNPRQAAAKDGTLCVKKLGTSVVKAAVINANLELYELHRFSQTEFEHEVHAALAEKHADNTIKAVIWYHSNNDPSHAEEFANDNLKKLSDDDIINTVVIELNLQPSNLLREATR